MGYVSEASNDTRFVIEGARYDIGYAFHLGRYMSVLDFAPEAQRILDFGCGSGYGAGYLASTGKDVCGADISQESVDYARQTYPGARFVAATLDIPLEDNAALAQCGEDWQAVVSFEVIEHVEDTLNFVRNIASLVAADGVAMIGCPNRLTSFEWDIEYNEDHIHEFTPYQLDQHCRIFFRSVQIAGLTVHAPLKKTLYQTNRNLRSRLRVWLRSSNWAGSAETGFWGGIRRVLRRIRQLRGQTMAPSQAGYISMADLKKDFIGFTTDPELVKGAAGIIAICRDPILPVPAIASGQQSLRMSRMSDLMKSNGPRSF